MAGFETFVRPVIFPNIRPIPTQALQPEADPTKGLAVIRGASIKTLTLPSSWNVSVSRSMATEKQRRSDTMRVYQEEDDGTVNENNFIDLEVPNKITMQEGGEKKNYNYARMKESDSVELRERDKVSKNS